MLERESIIETTLLNERIEKQIYGKNITRKEEEESLLHIIEDFGNAFGGELINYSFTGIEGSFEFIKDNVITTIKVLWKGYYIASISKRKGTLIDKYNIYGDKLSNKIYNITNFKEDKK